MCVFEGTVFDLVWGRNMGNHHVILCGVYIPISTQSCSQIKVALPQRMHLLWVSDLPKGSKREV